MRHNALKITNVIPAVAGITRIHSSRRMAWRRPHSAVHAGYASSCRPSIWRRRRASLRPLSVRPKTPSRQRAANRRSSRRRHGRTQHIPAVDRARSASDLAGARSDSAREQWKKPAHQDRRRERRQRDQEEPRDCKRKSRYRQVMRTQPGTSTARRERATDSRTRRVPWRSRGPPEWSKWIADAGPPRVPRPKFRSPVR